MKHLFLFLTSIFIFVNGNSAVSFYLTKTASCPPVLVTKLVDNSTHPKVVSSRTIYWGDGTNTVSYTDTTVGFYYNIGQYDVKMVVTYVDGTKDSVSYTTAAEVYNLPTIDITVSDSLSCGSKSVCFTNNSTPGSGTMNIQLMEIYNGTHWKDAAFMAATGGNFCYTYNTPGSYAIYAYAKSSVGCIKDTTFSWKIHIYAPQSMNFSGTPLTTCDTVITSTFQPTSALLPSQTISWVFDNNLGTSTALNPSFTFYKYQNPPFDVQMKYTQTFHNGILTCLDSVKKTSYVTCRNTYNNFDTSSKTRVCLGTAVSVKDTIKPSGTSLYNWGDGTANSASPHTYASPGTYSVKQIVTFPTGCKDSAFKANLFTVDPIPKAAFRITTDSVFCKAPATISLLSQSYNNTTQTWTFTGGTPPPSILTSTSLTPTITYNGQGSAKLVVSNIAGCKDSFAKTVVTFPGIKANFSATKIKGCVGDTITFTNLSTGLLNDTIVSYNWDFNGDGIFDSFHTLKVKSRWVYSDTTCRKVTLAVVGQSGCTDTIRVTICMNFKPIASYKVLTSKNICAGKQVKFLYTGSKWATRQYWYPESLSPKAYSGPLVDSPMIDTFKYTFPTKGKYTPALVVNNNGCLDTALIYPSEYDTIKVTGASAGNDFGYSVICTDRFRAIFTSNTSSANRVLWDFGVTTSTLDTSTSLNPSFLYPAKGCYNAKIIAYNDTAGCSDTAFKRVCVYKPNLKFTVSDTVTCKYQNICFTNTSDTFDLNPTSTIFNTQACFPFGPVNPFVNGIINGSPACFSYYFDGAYSIGMRSMDPNGCFDTAVCKTNLIKITDPFSKFNIDKDPTICVGSTIKVTDMSTSAGSKPLITKTFKVYSPSNTLLMTFPDSIKVISVFTTPGTYKIEHFVSDGVCSRTNDTFITVIDPLAAMQKNDDNVCPGQDVSFTNNNIQTGVSYKWYFENANIDSFSGTTPPNVSFNITGSHLVKMVAYFGNLPCKSWAYDTVHIKKPIASFNQDIVSANCGPQLATFCNTSVGENLNEWCWNFNDPYDNKNGYNDCMPDSATCAIHNFLNPFVYNVCLKVKTASGCYDSVCHTLTIAGPELLPTPTVIDSCGSAKIKFVLSSRNACQIYMTPPSINYPSPISHCDTFCGTGTKPNCIDTPTVIFTNPGSHTLRIVVVDAGNTCVKIHDFGPYFVYTPPVAKIKMSDSMICRYNSIDFIDSSVYANIYLKNKWTFNTGTNTTKNVTNYYPNPGNYTAKLFVEDVKGCKDSTTSSIVINQKPEATFFGKDVCLGNSTQFKYTSADSNVNFFWDFGVATLTDDTSIAQHPKYTYSTAGLDSVTCMIVDANGCMDTSGGWVKVFSPPVADFDSSGFCVGLPTTFKNKSKATAPNFFLPTKYAFWDFNYPSSDTSKNDDGFFVYIPQGNYNVFLKVKDNQGCVDSVVKVVTINGSPIAQFSVTPAKTCFGAPIVFKDISIPVGGPLTGWEWDTDGNGSIDENVQNIPPKSFPTSGNYYPSMILTDANGCKDTSKNTIIIVDKPIVDFTSTARHCKDSLFYFTNTTPNIGAIATWEWYFGEDNGPNDFSLNTIHAYSFSDDYVVRLIGVDTIGCRDTVDHKIKVDEPPVIIRVNPEFNPTYICEGEVLTAKVAGADKFSWGNDPYVSLLSGDTVVLIATPISKKFYFKGTNGSCPDITDFIDVRIIPKRPLTLTVRDSFLIKGQTTELKAEFTGSGSLGLATSDVQLTWLPLVNISCSTCLQPYVTPYTTTYYKAKIVYTKWNTECVSEDSIQVIVSDSCSIADVNMPLSFTPGEATNNRFYPAGPALESVEFFKIYDRWGNIVFETTAIRANDASVGWDGKHQECHKDMEAGVYIYQIGVKCKNGNLICINRDVTLLR